MNRRRSKKRTKQQLIERNKFLEHRERELREREKILRGQMDELYVTTYAAIGAILEATGNRTIILPREDISSFMREKRVIIGIDGESGAFKIEVVEGVGEE